MRHYLLRRLTACLGQAAAGYPGVLACFLLSALFVIGARVLVPLPLGWDQAAQLEASHRLVQGLGLTSTFFSVPATDLTPPPAPLYLTWWPPGFSLLVAGALRLGLSLGLALKAIFSIVTLVGWSGWGALACRCLTQPLRFGRFAVPAHYLFACALPLFYTPDWGGTDSFLWAGVPFVILLLLPSNAPPARQWWSVAAAGGLFGLLYSFRYASLFLLPVAFLLLLQAYSAERKALLRYLLVFIGAALMFVLPVTIYNSLYKATAGLPEYVNPAYGWANWFETVGRIWEQLPTLLSIFKLPLLQVVIARLETQALLLRSFGVAALILLLILPVGLLVIKPRVGERRRDIGLALSFVLVALVGFLLACMFINPYGFLGDQRYYLPAGIAAILIIYDLATQRLSPKLLRVALSLFLLFSMLYEVVYRPTELVRGKGGGFVQNILGYVPPSGQYFELNRIVTRGESALTLVKQLQQANPSALFFVYTEVYPYWVHDGHAGFRPIFEGDFWQTAYVSAPSKIFWVVPSSCQGVCASLNGKEIDGLTLQPGLRLVADFPAENVKILVAEWFHGYRPLTPTTAGDRVTHSPKTVEVELRK